MITAINPISI